MLVGSKNGVRRYRLSRQEVEGLIDREARKRLQMSGQEFLRRLKERSLPESVAKRDIEMLASLIDAEKVQ